MRVAFLGSALMGVAAVLQDEFGVEQDDVYEIIAAWHDHAADVEEYVALQEECGLDAKGMREVILQHRQRKKDLDEYEALRRDVGMDTDGMRKVSYTPPPCGPSESSPCPVIFLKLWQLKSCCQGVLKTAGRRGC